MGNLSVQWFKSFNLLSYHAIAIDTGDGILLKPKTWYWHLASVIVQNWLQLR